MVLGSRIWCLSLALTILPAATGDLRAQGRLDARYTIAVAGIPIGQAAWKVEIGPDRYAISANGGASSWLKILVSGRGEAAAQGVMQAGVPAPGSYAANVTSDDDVSDVRMTFEDRNVKDLTVAAAETQSDRIPVNDADRKDVSDPLTALVVPSGPVDRAGRDACRPRLAIFDGRRRFDLRLAFKRVEQVKTERGYQGLAVVCAMTFHPVSGHRPSSTLTNYLAEGRDMELWFAPIAGTNLSAPYRLTIANLLGAMTVAPQQWDTASLAKERAAADPSNGPALRPSQTR